MFLMFPFVVFFFFFCSFQSGEGEINQNKDTGDDNPSQDEPFALQGDECEVYQCIETTPDEYRLGEPRMHDNCFKEVCILCCSISKNENVIYRCLNCFVFWSCF